MNDISWMLVRRLPGWEFFLPWVVLLSWRGSESRWRRQVSPWRTASNGLNICDHKPLFWRCLEGENYSLFSKHYNNNKSKTKNMDFPGGLVIKNLPANAGNTGSIPGPGRLHMPVCHNHWVSALESALCNKRSHRNKNPEHGRSRVAPVHCNYRMPKGSNEDPL